MNIQTVPIIRAINVDPPGYSVFSCTVLRLDRAIFSGKESSRASCQARRDGKRGNAVVYPDLPIWGKLEILRLAIRRNQRALGERKAEQFVRLIRIAGNTQLKNMLRAGGKGVPARRSALRACRQRHVCPLYWVTREVNHKTDAIEIVVPKLPQKASRENILNILTESIHGILSAILLG